MVVSWPTAGDLMSPRPITVQTEAPLSQALGLMRAHSVHELPVLRRKVLAGMITLESIARRTNLPLTTKAGHLMVLPPLVTAATPYPELAEKLLASGLRATLVVGRRDELIGIVSRTDMVRVLPTVVGMAQHAVEDIASPVGTLVSEKDSLDTLLNHVRVLEEHPLPVVDRSGRLVGAVGLADLTRVFWRPKAAGKRDAVRHDPRERHVLQVDVASIMHSPAITVPVGTSTETAARVMSEKSVSSLIVVDGGRPVGVLSQGDLLGLAVGVGLGGKSAKPTSDVYVQIHGLRGSADPETLGEIDQVVAQGLRRISRHVKPLLLSLHITPHSNHRSGDASVVARLHTDRGIFYASETEWNYFAGIAALMDDLGEQVRRAKDDARQRRRVGPLASQVRVDETVGDDALEAQLRTMTPQRAPRRR